MTEKENSDLGREKWVVVSKSRDFTEAHLVRIALEDQNIPTHLENEAMNNMMPGIFLDGVNIIKIMVPESYINEARLTLENNQPPYDNNENEGEEPEDTEE